MTGGEFEVDVTDDMQRRMAKALDMGPRYSAGTKTGRTLIMDELVHTEFGDKSAENEPKRPKPVRLNRHQRRAKAARQRKQGKKS